MTHPARWGLLILILGLGLPSRAFAAEPGSEGAYSTIVRGDAAGASARPAQTQITIDEGGRLAGGFGDAVRAIESLPGVARTPLGSAALVLWGAAPGDSRAFYLGMELPSLYHASGLRTALPGALLSGLRLLPAGFGPEYGRALGGVLVLTPRQLPAGWHGELAADLLDASLAITGALGSRLRIFVGGRYSYLDRLLSALSRPELGAYFPLPQYYDAQAQAQLQLAGGATLRATLLASGDTTVRAHGRGGIAETQRETRSSQSYRLGLHYERPGDQGRGAVQLSPWLGLDRRRYDADFGGQPTESASDDLLYGLQGSYRLALPRPRPSLAVSLLLGVDALGRYAQASREGTLTRPARDEDVAVFGQSPGLHVNGDAWSVHLLDLALYAAVGLRVHWLRIEPGLRIGATLSDVSRLLPRVGDLPPLGGRQIEGQAAPRLLLALQPRPSLRFSVAGGLYLQPPSPSDLSAVFGRPRLGLGRAIHLSAAGEWSPHPRLHIEVAGYLRLLDQLATRSPLATPPLAGALTGEGSGRSYGGQVLLRLLDGMLGRGRWASQLSGWLGYSLARGERRAGPGQPLQPSPYDQTHSLQATLAAQIRRLVAALRLQYTTGLPRQAVLGGYYNALADQYEPLLGPLGSARLPDFLQLDLRLEYTFVLGAGLRLATQLEIQNLTNQKNVQEQAYSADWQVAEPIPGLPTLAVLGLRVSR